MHTSTHPMESIGTAAGNMGHHAPTGKVYSLHAAHVDDKPLVAHKVGEINRPASV